MTWGRAEVEGVCGEDSEKEEVGSFEVGRSHQWHFWVKTSLVCSNLDSRILHPSIHPRCLPDQTMDCGLCFPCHPCRWSRRWVWSPTIHWPPCCPGLRDHSTTTTVPTWTSPCCWRGREEWPCRGTRPVLQRAARATGLVHTHHSRSQSHGPHWQMVAFSLAFCALFWKVCPDHCVQGWKTTGDKKHVFIHAYQNGAQI